MIVEVLFVVFLVLWGASAVAPNRAQYATYAGWLPWICVALLGWVVFAGHHVLG